MMKWESARCWACNAQTSYDPTKVPRANGQPLCLRCVIRVNELLTEANERPVVIEDGTYEDA